VELIIEDTAFGSLDKSFLFDAKGAAILEAVPVGLKAEGFKLLICRITLLDCCWLGIVNQF
jgi:hypothetical protein